VAAPRARPQQWQITRRSSLASQRRPRPTSNVRAHPVPSGTSKFASIAIAMAAVAWLWLVLGLVCAKFLVTEPPPNVVITFSDKGLARVLAELVSLGIGFLGLVLALVIAFDQTVRRRLRALAVVSNVAVCAVCVALLM